MKIICDKDVITSAVSGVSKAVSSKAAMPVLEGIYVKASGSVATFIGYDLSIAIKTTVEADVREEGGIIINARLFSDFLRSARQSVSITTDEKNNVKLASGRAEISIAGRSISEFPEIPEVEDNNSVSMEYDMFKKMVNQTVFATAVEDNNQLFKGVNFEFRENMIRLVGIDGKRLAIRNEKVINEKELSFIVPAKTLTELVRLTSDDAETVDITLDRNHVSFFAGGFTVISRLIYGDYVKYETIIPQEREIEIRVNVRDFINAIERVSLMITERVKSPVRIALRDNTINFRCISEVGVATDSIECENNSESAIVLGFNNKYMLDALKATDCDEVKMEFISPIKPIKITPLEGDDFIFIVMPVQVELEQ